MPSSFLCAWQHNEIYSTKYIFVDFSLEMDIIYLGKNNIEVLYE